MNKSSEAVKARLREQFKKEKGQVLSEAEIEDAANGLVAFFDLLYKAELRLRRQRGKSDGNRNQSDQAQ